MVPVGFWTLPVTIRSVWLFCTLSSFPFNYITLRFRKNTVCNSSYGVFASLRTAAPVSRMSSR